ncbi:MAG TPA: AsmA family protein [Burkholderiales bacterium]|nr:AsmA family protein [Burkholderiales bacterium]
MRLPRWLKYTLAGFAALCALAAIALAVVVQTIDVDRYARLAIAEVKATTGRELVIRGKLDVSVFPRLAVRAEDVSFANATWGSRPEMFKAKRVDGAVALLPLLRHKVEITRLAVTDLDLRLETDAKGIGNWVFKTPTPGAISQPARAGSDFELDVGELVVDRGSLAWRSGASKETTRLAVRRLQLKERTLGNDLDVDASAAFRDQAFTVKGRMGRILALIAKATDWPVDVVATTDGASVTAKGAIDWSAALPALDLALKAEFKHTAGVAKLAGTPLDLPMPATLAAKFTSGKGEQVADPLKLTLGRSTLGGRASLRTDGARPFLSATLSSPEIDLAQSPAVKRERRNGARVFSDAPFPLEALRKLDADADLAIGRLVLPDKVPLETLKVRAVLKGGRLEVQPFSATVGGGPVSGRVVLDASRPNAPTLAVALDGKGISMERIAAATGHAGTVSGGATDVAINLGGPGESLARFVGGGNGEVRIVVGAARASGAALDAGGGAITSILDKVNPFRRTDPYTDIRCAVVRLPVRDGIATSQRTMAYETAKVNMVMAGTINLRTEALDLAIRPTVKEGIGIGAGALSELVRVTGTLSDPSIGIDTLGSARAALSVGGALLTGGLSLLGEAAVAKATADQHPCQTALAGGEAAGGKPSKTPAPEPKKEDGGLLGSVRRLFK